jgi:hypothetical protein
MHASGTAALIFTLGTAIAGIGGSQAHLAGEPLSDNPASVATAVETPRAYGQGGNPLWAVPLGKLSATRDRPIFSASRRPPAPPAVFAVAAAPSPKPVAVPPVADRPPLVLIGTIIGESKRIGIFLEETTSKTARLVIGQDHGGWILRSVNNREARFDNADRSATLVLRPPAQAAVKGNLALAATEPVIPARHRKR